MPSDFSMRAMNAVHRAIMRLSGNRLGWDIGGMPVLELTTIGRKSGERRSTMLTAPLREGDGYVVVASKGGDDAHPAWFLNLRDDPRVDVALDGRSVVPMTARIATADERASMWPRITAKYRNYEGYQKKTAREIPLVILDPVP
jgi:deazaflavin-dependent oxidoreductase (nitroreductase family)